MEKEFEMTQEDLDGLIDNANPFADWKRLGEKMGFDHMTVRPSAKSLLFFYAEPK